MHSHTFSHLLLCFRYVLVHSQSVQETCVGGTRLPFFDARSKGLIVFMLCSHVGLWTFR